ncbi:hypothetical protein ACK3TF_001968 [Chlorella vulgaris]
MPPKNQGNRLQLFTACHAEHFRQSWHRFSPHTRIVLWVEEGTTLDDHGVPVKVIRFSQTTDNNLVKLQRYALYKSFLEELLRQGYTGGVVLADARDVFIQSDPWQDLTIRKLVQQDALLFSLEGRPEDDEGKAIPIVSPITGRGHVQLNFSYTWIDICFGKATLKNVSDLPISCSGVTVGGIGAVAAYVNQLLHVAFNIAKRGCRFSGGSDQGVHDYMLHVLGPSSQLNLTYHVLKNWDSPVFTAGHGWPHHLDSCGVFQRGDGSGTEASQMLPPPIVHQYDKRGGGMTLLMRAMYPVLTEEYHVLGPERGNETAPLSACLAACQFC